VILLDTHAAVWLANDNPSLGPKSRLIALAARDENQLAISAISFWEIALLVSKDRSPAIKSWVLYLCMTAGYLEIETHLPDGAYPVSPADEPSSLDTPGPNRGYLWTASPTRSWA
jgi:hypothetical protein